MQNVFDDFDDTGFPEEKRWSDRFDWLSWRRWFRKERVRIHQGYEQVYDYASKQWYFTHRLVAEKKIGKAIPDGYEVHHINGDKLDNRPENLAIIPADIHREIHEEAQQAALEGRDYVQALKEANNKRSLNDISIEHPPLDSAMSETTSEKQTSTAQSMSAQTLDTRALYHNLLLTLIAPNITQSWSLNSGYICPRCGGRGYLPEFRHVANGICFLCGDSGRSPWGSGKYEWDDYDYYDMDDYYDDYYDYY